MLHNTVMGGNSRESWRTIPAENAENRGSHRERRGTPLHTGSAARIVEQDRPGHGTQGTTRRTHPENGRLYTRNT